MLCLGLHGLIVMAAAAGPVNDPWTRAAAQDPAVQAGEPWVRPEGGSVFRLDLKALRDELAKAPSAYFEPDDPFRELIDSCTVLHYQEHGTHIRNWAASNSPAAARN